MAAKPSAVSADHIRAAVHDKASVPPDSILPQMSPSVSTSNSMPPENSTTSPRTVWRRDLADAIEKVSRVPCAVGHGVVEVWPLE
jgi:hypothetical protein